MELIQISVEQMRNLTGEKERNIYVHPNPLARWIFWSRLRELYRVLRDSAKPNARVADVGGGSGAFLPGLNNLFKDVTVLDLDCSDATAIKTHLGLESVAIRELDIFTMDGSEQFDVMVFADVLEHFRDLEQPIGWIKTHLKQGGLLAVSLPTENWVYELGRALVRKQKPLDHYHTSREVMARLEQAGFLVQRRSFMPRLILPIPLFQIGLLSWVETNG